MGNIILVVGGARSGKSSYALSMGRAKKKVAFVATCEPRDDEMRSRIAAHQKARPVHWKTFEAPTDVGSVLKRLKGFELVIVDCATLLVSNLFLSGASRAVIEKKVRSLMAAAKSKPFDTVIVSNEVGLGIVPEHRLGRDFRDIAGSVNQIMAQQADTVFFMMCGIPARIK